MSTQVDFNQNNLKQLSKKPEAKTNDTSPSIEEDSPKGNDLDETIKLSEETAFRRIILNGIENGNYYTPKANKVISKYDTILTNSNQYPRYNDTINNMNSNFMINNRFQNQMLPIFIPQFANVGTMKSPDNNNNLNNPDRGRNKNTVKQNNKENNRRKGKRNSSDKNAPKKIIIDDILIGKEKRTTLMLRNIPNKYTLINVVEEINSSFWGKYDYINLPIDFERKLNLGYAFINFVEPMHIILFYETYHMKKWSKFRSDKKMDMTFAEKQGKKDYNCKDEQTYFAIEDKRFNFSSLTPKIEIPISHLDFFKKIYPNSVCVVEDKHGIYNDKCFVVKSMGRKN